MRLLLIDIFILVSLITGGYFTYHYFGKRRVEKKMVEAYFSGGPLDHQTRKMIGYPKEFLWQMSQPELMTANADTEETELVATRKVAVYEHNGAGVYQYFGTRDENFHYDNYN
jgi:hypothetical protein